MRINILNKCNERKKKEMGKRNGKQKWEKEMEKRNKRKNLPTPTAQDRPTAPLGPFPIYADGWA